MPAIFLLLVLVHGVSAGESCTLVKTWTYEGGLGTIPPDISIDPSGAVYVTGPEDSRVWRYSPEGSLTTYWVLNDTEYGTTVVPAGIVVDASHRVFVTDRKNSTIHILNSYRKELWGHEGTGKGGFDHPTGIAVDSSGTVYIADTGNNRVQKIHSGGTWLLQWGSYGTALGAFHAPGSIAIDARDQVYVTDAGNNRIQKFTSDGVALAAWGTPGTGAGQFLSPSGTAVDSWGNVYVTDLTTRIQKFSPTGEYFTTCNTSGIAHDIAFSPSGEVYVVMQSGSSWEIGVYRFSPERAGEPPGKRRTFAVVVPQTPRGRLRPDPTVTVQGTLLPEQSVPAVTILTMTPEVTPVLTSTPALPSPAGNTTVIWAPGDRAEDDIRVSTDQADIFDRIAGFFSSVFGVQIPISA